MSAARQVKAKGLWLAAAVAAALLSGCAADKPKPAELQAVTAKIAGRQVWSASIGSVGFPMQPVLRGDRLFVASDDGTVAALDTANGREAWRAQVGARLSAGVGSDGRFSAVVTRDNELVVLEGAELRWRQKIDTAVVTAPLVAGERVFVLGVDRTAQAFDALDGRRLWVYRRPGDALLLSQPGVLTAYRDTLLVGQGGRLVGLDPTRGSLRWDVPVATPRGTNEVERLADLVGPATRQEASFCVRAFQNAVGCVDAQRGALQWTQNTGGVQAVGGDAGLLVGGDASDRLTARQRANGGLAWSSDLLLNRGLSAPVVVGPTVVVGDFEGQMHFLSREDGQPLLRLPTDGSRIVSAPVLSGTTLMVVTARGGVFAFRPE